MDGMGVKGVTATLLPPPRTPLHLSHPLLVAHPTPPGPSSTAPSRQPAIFLSHLQMRRRVCGRLGLLQGVYIPHLPRNFPLVGGLARWGERGMGPGWGLDSKSMR